MTLSHARAGHDVMSAHQWSRVASSLGLSRRELQIVQSIFDDDKELSMAYQLHISPHTVHTYIQRIYRKLGVSSRCELVVRVFGEYLDAPSGDLSTSDA